ncbi:MAG: LysR family transcriptional regulator [Phyllobacterium sp.]
MTLEQLNIFVAVAEREHLTRAATALHLTPSAVSSAIKTLENYYSVPLFNRVGRHIELTEAGRLFLSEAKATLARAHMAELVLSELGGLKRGTLAVHASQTIASYWVPSLLTRFHTQYPSVEIDLTIGNTQTVAQAVHEGAAEIGFIEGDIDEPALSSRVVANDRLIIVVPPDHPWADGELLEPKALKQGQWIMREAGSGTRSAFEKAVSNSRIDPAKLDVGLVFPSNEAVLSAVRCGQYAAVVSEMVALPHLKTGNLVKVNFDLPTRRFVLLRHKERHKTKASLALESLIDFKLQSP